MRECWGLSPILAGIVRVRVPNVCPALFMEPLSLDAKWSRPRQVGRRSLGSRALREESERWSESLLPFAE